MAERNELIGEFLRAAGWGGAVRAPLAGDASFRRYERLAEGTETAVLMDAPPPQEDVRPFLAIARHLAGLGYSAPQILAEDPQAGLLLLEDLGDGTYTRILADAPAGAAQSTEHDLYALAVDLLVDLHRRPADQALPAGVAAYDAARLLDEALLLTDWYLPAVSGRPTIGAARGAYEAAWREALGPVLEAAPTLVLRDYHVDNLMWLPEREGIGACGLLDFQDAVAGAAAYDLMSLLEDARRDIAPELKAAMWARYMDAFPDLGPGAAGRDAFETQFAVLAAQRHAKVIGIFTRLFVRDAKPDYLVHIPRVWKLLEGHMGHPALAPVARWFAEHVPAELRRVPEAGE